jgi:hypothetical protein
MSRLLQLLLESLAVVSLSCSHDVKIVAASAQGEKPAPQTLNDQTFNHWREFIHPSAAESAWERPGWQTSLWTGLSLAQEKKMPLVVWFMTGHPCGMT